uniref:Centriole, cilia and spindle-associated protein n=1 Tax=Ciona intestinalis TaxID=7719 RepID=F6R508_CIOIN|nr:centriole, cilia and spindle-associated protein [Ciona intestinalis]|eukprot:XP_002125275.1 centriole, cilia and spindle-associated protein [Ciona intestinalis]
MKLRVRKSEYQRSYAKPSDEYIKTLYRDQVTYRSQRREKEQEHFKFKWESESSDSKSDKGSDNQDCNDNNTNLEVESIEAVDRLSGGENSEKEMEEVESAEQNKATNKIKNSERNSRVKSRSSTRCKSRERSTSAKPPFVSYGWADEQLETGRKKTHNVQAPRKSVHVAALKRQSYMEKLKEKKLRSASRASSILNVPVLQNKASDSSAWQTEYQRCFSRQSERPETSNSKRSGRKSKQSRKLKRV